MLQAPANGRAVAFDADGTLWRGDIGEDLLRYLAAHDLLPNHLGRRGVYAEYERRLHHVQPASAFAYAVEVMAGMNEQALQELCANFFRQRFEGRVFGYARDLLEQLHRAGFALWIVSASPIWPVVAGARALGVPAQNVIGVRCDVEDGVLTGRVTTPVPCDDGKVHWLKECGVRPALAFGNGDLDLPMLAYAERAVAVGPPAPHHGGDNALLLAAKVRGWPILRC